MELRAVNPTVTNYFPLRWYWKPQPWPGRVVNRKGKPCRVLARGAMNSVLVEFEEDGYRVIASRYAVRKD